jgi:uncharacterized protein (TIGR03118 family)
MLAAAMAVLMSVALVRSDNGGPSTGFYVRTDLVTDDVEGNGRMIAPWGIAYRGAGPFWINNEGTGFSSVYFGDGTAYYNVAVPSPGKSTGGSAPTGIVANATSTGFLGDTFIFATETGTISGWQRRNGLSAQIRVDRSASGAAYKGLALVAKPAGGRLFATNFAAGTIDVFDAAYRLLNPEHRWFIDPSLPQGYAPFGIIVIKNHVLVTYALKDAEGYDDSPGPHRGFINIFTLNGELVRRFASQGTLNSPWGMAVAPRDFGPFGGDLLVGNFGDGTISAFDPQTGDFRGRLADRSGSPLVIDGLWGLIFGNDGYAGPRDSMFYTAGTNRGLGGAFGRITAAYD